MNMFPSLYSGYYGMRNQDPYTYGRQNEMPMAMEGLTHRMPPLYPSMETPQAYPPDPFPNYNLAQARYAMGGYVDGEEYEEQNPLSYITDLLRQAGQREDSVLAHINPEEAQELGENYGYDFNPLTGLPQYGKWKHAAKKLGKKAKNLAKYALPVIGGVGGALVGGPVGGAIGGGLGGAGGSIVSKGKIKPAHMLKSTALGGIGGYFAGPAIAEGGKGLFSQGLPGLTSGMSSGFNSSLAGLGLGGSGTATASPQIFGKASGMPQISSALPKSVPRLAGYGSGLGKFGSLPSITGSGSAGGSSLLDKLLLGTAVIGTLGRKERTRIPKETGPFSFYQNQLRDELQQRKLDDVRRQEEMRHVRPLQRRFRSPPQGYSAVNDPEWNYFEEANPYRKGGYIDGNTGGQDDKIPALLSDGEYVHNATVVSALGDGNNRAGALKLKQMDENILRHKRIKGFPPKAKPLNKYIPSKTRSR